MGVGWGCFACGCVCGDGGTLTGCAVHADAQTVSCPAYTTTRQLFESYDWPCMKTNILDLIMAWLAPKNHAPLWAADFKG